MWQDGANGNIGFSASEMIEGELLDTFFIVPIEDIPDLFKMTITEKKSFLYGNKWKPKTLDVTENGVFKIVDPDHIVTVKGRKKQIAGKVFGTYSYDDLKKMLRYSIVRAFFNISEMKFDNSKEKKKYNAEQSRWVKFAQELGFNPTELALEGNSLHFRLFPIP